MVALSHSLHCLSHRRPYYMPYLVWGIPFLSALNFNANTLILTPYSAGCFDIMLHFMWFSCVLFFFFFFYRFSENQWGDLFAPPWLNVISTCWLLRKTRCNWTECGTGASLVLGASADVEREKAGLEWARASGEWEKRVEENWESLWSPTLQIRGAERGSKWPVLCGWCDTLKSQSHLQHSLHQVH